ncbi:MAG: serine/threonine-protein kinase, partial [Gemmatimonadota bacterium]
MLATLGFATGIGLLPPFTAVNRLAHVVLFASVGVMLRVLGGGDARAHALGTFLIVLATAWSDSLLVGLAGGAPSLQPISALLQHLQIVAFAPYLFWMFIREFPHRRAFHRSRRVEIATNAALVVGAALLLANASRIVWTTGSVAGVTSWLDRTRLDRLFWPLVFAFSFPAIVYAAWQAKRAAPDERRRVKVMLFGLILGLAPEIALTLLAAVVPEVRTYLNTTRGRLVLATTVSAPELAIPLTVAYAVMVHRALDVRLLVRRVLQYAFARTTLVFLMTAPLLGLLAILYLHRDEPLTRVFSGLTGALLLGAIGTGVAAAALRPRLLSALDHRFFREQYDARSILSGLVENIRALHDPTEIATVVPAGIDRALHVESASVFLLDQGSQQFVAPGRAVRPLPAGSRLLSRLSEHADSTYDMDWSGPDSTLADVPEDEQQWLAESGARLLVAIRDHTGAVIGAIGLGEKRSGLPFSGEDRLLLRTIADAVGLAVERQTIAARVLVASHEADTAANECDLCGLVAGEAVGRCGRCGGPLVHSQVPLLLAGKFRPIERVGRGGMGVVYRAVDVTLGRDVALKTLPRMSAAHAARMRREARAMAAVSHPNLEAIYSAETWRGSPALVVEFLHAGTLADRLARDGALAIADALGTGSRLAGALACLHDAGLLHRDIKTSNIGFASDGTVKLLDFGLARVLEAGDGDGPTRVTQPADLLDGDSGKLTATGDIVGTVPYLSPEAIEGAGASAGFDLWALSMVVYEAIAGRHPFLPGRGGREEMQRG